MSQRPRQCRIPDCRVEHAEQNCCKTVSPTARDCCTIRKILCQPPWGLQLKPSRRVHSCIVPFRVPRTRLTGNRVMIVARLHFASSMGPPAAMESAPSILWRRRGWRIYRR